MYQLDMLVINPYTNKLNKFIYNVVEQLSSNYGRAFRHKFWMGNIYFTNIYIPDKGSDTCSKN